MDYYQNTPVILQFDKCNRHQCHSIPIVNDNMLEGDETFYVILEGPADLDRDKILLDRVIGTINIVNVNI